MLSITSPIQTVLVSCRAKIEVDGKKQVRDNLMTLSWHMPVSFNPEMYAIALGKTRFSLELIQASKVFVVNFMPYILKDEAVYCGNVSGKNEDKFQKSGLTKVEAEKIKCPMVKEALAYLECRVEKEIDVGDHILIIGNVVKAVSVRKGKRLFNTLGDNFTTTLD